MTAPLIHGLVMARNEWPLLELAITHALVHHVDRVHVLDHASTDGTAAGLRRLRHEWGERLSVVHLGACPYLQEAATSLLRETVAAAPEDWIYVFDADEFGIAGPTGGLRDILAGIEPRHQAVRYEVQNWVAPADFTTADLDRYATLHYRAVPALFLPVPPEVLVDEIVTGAVNYFDVPFESKIVVRGSAAGWTTAGCHRLAGIAAPDEVRVPPATFRVAHFPLLERRRLNDRVAQGYGYLENGFDSSHGWQSQMLVRVAERGDLEAFWACHSLPAGCSEADSVTPIVIRDDGLAPLLARTLARVRKSRHGIAFGQDPVVEASTDTATVVPAALRTIRALQATADDLRRQLDDAIARARQQSHVDSGPRRDWRHRISAILGLHAPGHTAADGDPRTTHPARSEPCGDPHVLPLVAPCSRPDHRSRTAA